jgi:aspartyl aminopeptidase
VIDQLFGEDIEPLSEDKYNTEAKHYKTLLNLISKDL